MTTGRSRRDDPPPRTGAPRLARPGATPPGPRGPWQGLRGGHRVRTSRAWQMNTGLMLDGSHALLVDPGVLPSEIADVCAAVPVGCELLVAFTHHHWDHVMARPWLPAGVRTLAHERFAAALATDAEHARAEAARHAAEHGESYDRSHEPFAPDIVARDGDVVRHGPFTIEVRHVPGHATDAIALLVREARVLFAGDLLSDTEPPALDEPPAVLRDSLERLEPWLRESADVMVAGHGSIARGARVMGARLRADRAYLDALEAGVAECVQAGLDADATVPRLDSLAYAGRDGKPYSTDEWHRANVRLVWNAAARR